MACTRQHVSGFCEARAHEAHVRVQFYTCDRTKEKKVYQMKMRKRGIYYPVIMGIVVVSFIVFWRTFYVYSGEFQTVNDPVFSSYLTDEWDQNVDSVVDSYLSEQDKGVDEGENYWDVAETAHPNGTNKDTVDYWDIIEKLDANGTDNGTIGDWDIAEMSETNGTTNEKVYELDIAEISDTEKSVGDSVVFRSNGDDRNVLDKSSNVVSEKTNIVEERKSEQEPEQINKGYGYGAGSRSQKVENLVELQAENNLRLQLFGNICSKNASFTNAPLKRRPPIYLESKDFHLSYCYMRKSGSTTMKNAIRLMGLKSLKFSDLRKEALRIIDFPHWPSDSKPNYDTVLIARNPFERLYSAYRDRIYLLEEAWRYQPGLYKKCPTKSGFETFLRKIIDKVKQVRNNAGLLDGHFAPLTWQCLPCKYQKQVKYIVHFEDYAPEMELVWANIGLKGDLLKTIREVFYRTLPANATDLNGRALCKMQAFLKADTKCIGDMEMAGRIWDSLQKEGELKKMKQFPANQFSKKFPLTPENLGRLVFKNQIPPEVGEKQRTDALKEAYAKIPKDLIRDITKIYQGDFELFGYDKDPPKS